MTREIERMDERMYLDEANEDGLDEDMEIVIGDVPALGATEIYPTQSRAEFVRPDTCHTLHARIAELEKERDAAEENARLMQDRLQRLIDGAQAANARVAQANADARVLAQHYASGQHDPMCASVSVWRKNRGECDCGARLAKKYLNGGAE